MNYRAISLLCALISVGFVTSDCDSDVTVSSTKDYDSIKDCSQYNGNIKFEGSSLTAISFPKLTKFKGDLEILEEKALTSVSLPKLEEITGTFSINNSTALAKLDLPKLTTAGGFTLEDNSGLSSLNFSSGLSSLGKFSVQRTQLTALGGITATEAEKIEIFSNVVLGSVELKELQKTSSDFRFEANSEKASIKLPSLGSIGGNLIYTKSLMLFVPKLKEVTGYIHLADSTDPFFKFDALEKIGNKLTLTSNNNITNATFPNLAVLQNEGLLIFNNGNLKTLDLSKLSTVGGGFNVTNPSISSIKLSDDLTATGAASIFANISCEDFTSKYSAGISNIASCANSNGDGKANLTNSTDSTKKDSDSSASLAKFSSPLFFALGAFAYFL